MVESFAETADPRWIWLCKLGGAASLIMVALIPIQIVVFVASPPPSAVADYFALFQYNRLLGLLDLDLLLIVDNVLAIALYLAFYVALRRVDESFMAVATTLGLISIVLYITRARRPSRCSP